MQYSPYKMSHLCFSLASVYKSTVTVPLFKLVTSVFILYSLSLQTHDQTLQSTLTFPAFQALTGISYHIFSVIPQWHLSMNQLARKKQQTAQSVVFQAKKKHFSKQLYAIYLH